ncbi:MAG TPA: thioesterase family protein [Chitinophagaceae bacterium]|nr:thioesterase family protein [Chitinophagaceae bacterium]
MARSTIELPAQFRFSCTVPVRITDLNYGGHVGNDTVLSLIQEARVQFLARAGYTELNCAGVGLIMRDMAVEFKRELLYGDQPLIGVLAHSFTRAGFELYYKVEILQADNRFLAVAARTGMVSFNYTTRKVTALPEEVRLRLEAIG